MFFAFAAGVVRGYSGFGFGFAMSLTLGLPAAQVIPVVLKLDLVCSARLWPGALKTFDPRIGGQLIAGMLLAVPLGGVLLFLHRLIKTTAECRQRNGLHPHHPRRRA